MANILLVDDDRDLVDILSFALRRAAMTPIAAYDARSALASLRKAEPDLIVLDINLGAESGLDVLKEVRKTSTVPIILLTGRSSEDDKVRGLDAGAEDYVSKPFSHRELIARIQAHLRRPSASGSWQVPRPSDGLLQVGTLQLNLGQHSVTVDGQPVSLSVTEFRLLHYLMVNAGHVAPNAAIQRHVWGFTDPGASDIVRVTVHRLRRKIEEDPSKPLLLHTVPGVGLLLRGPETDAEKLPGPLPPAGGKGES